MTTTAFNTYSYTQIAENFDLWQEYVDRDGTMSRNEFNALSMADRIGIQLEAFGPEVKVPTIEDLLAQTSIGNGYHDWSSEGGSIRVIRSELLTALEAAYDPLMPSWPATVDL